MLQNQLSSLKQEAIKNFNESKTSSQLYEAKVKYLGKNGQISLMMKELSSLPKEERPILGKIINEVKKELESLYDKNYSNLQEQELNQKINNESIDVSLPGIKRELGASHPINIVFREIIDILSRIGFSVRTSRLIEHERYNFDALNMPANHPARDMHDTFYIDSVHVLRTHTSPIQIHCLETEPPPLRILAPGAAFRCDSDASHSPHFHQLEGLLVDKKVTMGDLKGTITYFFSEFFATNLKTRFRPSFFPFTEPSAEFDVSCPICNSKGCKVCKYSGWVEIGGCGLVNPNVFKACNVKYPKWKGYAFGFGIERMAIIKYGIEDIRLFFENDLRFLKQFI